MTDEEMARLFIINKYDLRKDLEIWAIKNNCELSKEYYAYIAGLKAGKDMAETDIATVAYMQGAERYKPKWHKVADGDLPPVGMTVFISGYLGDMKDLQGFDEWDGEKWLNEDMPGVVRVAWCEIPQYTEE